MSTPVIKPRPLELYLDPAVFPPKILPPSSLRDLLTIDQTANFVARQSEPAERVHVRLRMMHADRAER